MMALILGECVPMPNVTRGLRSMKRLPARTNGSLEESLKVTARVAQRGAKPAFTYLGNSYGHAVWHVTYRMGDALNAINNMGDHVWRIDPDLTVHKCPVVRP